MTIRANRAPIDQIGFVTEDLDGTVRNWIDRFGVGPWQIYRNITLGGHYLGAKTSVTIDVALGYRGAEQIEFIQVISKTPPPYQHPDGAPMLGLHHLAWIVEDLEKASSSFEASGLTLVFAASNSEVAVKYFADPAQPGVLFELIMGATSRADHSTGVTLARDWAGTNPIAEYRMETTK